MAVWVEPHGGVIDGFRWALTGHGQPPGALLLASSGMVIAVVLGGRFFSTDGGCDRGSHLIPPPCFWPTRILKLL